jgi:hypothetical protein
MVFGYLFFDVAPFLYNSIEIDSSTLLRNISSDRFSLVFFLGFGNL